MAVNCSKVAHKNLQTFLCSVPYIHFSVNFSFMPMDSSRGRLIMQGAKKLLISWETFSNVVLITCSFSYTVMRNVKRKTSYKFKLRSTNLCTFITSSHLHTIYRYLLINVPAINKKYKMYTHDHVTQPCDKQMGIKNPPYKVVITLWQDEYKVVTIMLQCKGLVTRLLQPCHPIIPLCWNKHVTTL